MTGGLYSRLVAMPTSKQPVVRFCRSPWSGSRLWSTTAKACPLSVVGFDKGLSLERIAVKSLQAHTLQRQDKKVLAVRVGFWCLKPSSTRFLSRQVLTLHPLSAGGVQCILVGHCHVKAERCLRKHPWHSPSWKWQPQYSRHLLACDVGLAAAILFLQSERHIWTSAKMDMTMLYVRG